MTDKKKDNFTYMITKRNPDRNKDKHKERHIAR